MKAAETVVIAEIAPRAATNAAPGKNAAPAASSVRATAMGHAKASEVHPAMDDVTSDTATTAVARDPMAEARALVVRDTAVTALAAMPLGVAARVMPTDAMTAALTLVTPARPTAVTRPTNPASA